tara:strand:+ start:563 stop:706 length:144 start_codon:yes stop_codon:yes gene_type:complete
MVSALLALALVLALLAAQLVALLVALRAARPHPSRRASRADGSRRRA